MYDYRRLTPEERAKLIADRRACGFPAHEPPHPVRDRTLYLPTASCYNHQCLINSPDRRRELLNAIFEHFFSAGMEIVAWMILPNHYHLIADAVDMAELGQVFRAIYGATARFWNLADEQVGRKIWYRYTDRTIRTTLLHHAEPHPLQSGETWLG